MTENSLPGKGLADSTGTNSPGFGKSPLAYKQKNKEVCKNNIRVVCRFRPENEEELVNGRTIIQHIDDCLVIVDRKGSTNGNSDNHVFTFDRVFDGKTSQRDFFEYCMGPTMDDFMNGYNGTVIAYGQTGSGKTHSMMGPSIYNTETQGVIPRMVNNLFERIRSSSDDIQYTVGISFMEIYMEQIRDLLDLNFALKNGSNPGSPNSLSKSTPKRYTIQEDKMNGVHVKGLSQQFVSSTDEFFDVLKQGNRIRTNGNTSMNVESSRSHVIIQVQLEQVHSIKRTRKSSRLFLVDLAGSEKIDRTGAVGHSLEEAKKINSSLSTLGNVINALADGRPSHIPYRDSKLTRILQESLGGNSRTSLIINCSPSSLNENELISTLRFGCRAKTIKNKARINTEQNPKSLQLRIEVLEELNNKNVSYIHSLENEINSLKQKYEVPQSETQNLNSKNQSSNSLVNELEKREKRISEMDNTILNMKMENLKISHQEELKLAQLEELLRKLSDKLDSVELINVSLRKHLLLSEKIIESRDMKINKLKNTLQHEQGRASHESKDFDQKLNYIKQKLNSYSSLNENFENSNSPVTTPNKDDNSEIKEVCENTDSCEQKSFSPSSNQSPLSCKLGINLRIVKPLMGGDHV